MRGPFSRSNLRSAKLLLGLFSFVMPSLAYPAADAPERFPLILPDGCHAQLRRVYPYATEPEIGALRNTPPLEAFDIVCIGERISINETLRSSGGNVFILTKYLDFNDGIDTRPFFRKASSNPYADWSTTKHCFKTDIGFADISSCVKTFGLGIPTERFEEYEVNVGSVLSYDPSINSLYNEYYTKCVDCVRGGTETWIPELPSGITPPFINWPVPVAEWPADFPRAGLPPLSAELDRGSVRSGDLVIFAEEIRLPPISEQLAAPDPLDCKTRQVFQPAIIEVAGARGGRGGLGQPNACLGDPINRSGNSGWSCVGWDGGLNAPGGLGGHAGNVYIHYLGKSEEPRLRSHINVSGGVGGSRSKFRVPRDSVSRVCRMPRPGKWPPTPSGLPGDIFIDHASVEDAWAKIYASASILDGFYTYDLVDLAERAVLDERISSLTFTDYVQSAAAKFAMAAETTFVRETSNLVRLAFQIGQPVPVSKAWSVQDIDSLGNMPDFLRDQLTIGALLSTNDTGVKLSRYLKHVGGVEDLVRTDAQLHYRLQRIQETLSNQNAITSQINQSLKSIDSSLLNIDLRQAGAEIQKHIISLQSSIAEAWSAFSADEQRFNAEWKAAADDFLDGFLGMAGGAWSSGGTTAGISGFDVPLAKIGKAIIRFTQIKPTNAPPMQNLYKALLEAEEKFRVFGIEAQRLKETSRSLYAKSLVEAVRARRNSSEELANRLDLFPDLYRHIWLSYVMDPARDPNSLLGNLSALEEIASNITVPAGVQLRELGVGPDCENAIGGLSGERKAKLRSRGWVVSENCLILEPSAVSRIFSGTIDSAHQINIFFPLYVVAPFEVGLKKFRVDGFNEISVEPF